MRTDPQPAVQLTLALLFALLISLLPPGLGGALPAQAAGAVSLTTLGSAYTQDFNTLASTGTSSTVPTGWEFSESGTNANTTYTVGTGSGNAGDTYSFGAASNTERAFGGLLSGSLAPLIGAAFNNNTGGTITSLAIGYTGEQWRLGTSGRGADRLDFQYSTDATSLTSGTWVDVDTLDFSSPTVGTVGALDGNSAINRTALVATISGLTIPTGAAFWIRWADFNVSGADDGLSVDDFSLTPSGVVPPGLSINDISLNEGNSGTTTFGFTVSLAAPAGAGGVTFDIATQDGTATLADNDYVAQALTAQTIPAGSSTYSFSVVVNGDTKVEPDEALLVNVTNVVGASVADGQGQGTIVNDDDPCTLTYTPIPTIQGSGLSAAVTGVVTTKGVVVGDYEGPSPTLRGFYLQDATGDANPTTSDGIFVFNGNNNSVNLGDVVYVTGTAAEFQDQTQISSTSITKCGTGAVAPVDVTFPVPSATFLEQYEGMLVRLPQTMFVTEHFQLGRFGQVVLSSGARLKQPTNVVAPGALAQALQAQNNLNKIIVDDASLAQNPDPIVFGRGGNPLSASNTLRGGDTATGIVGIMTYTWAGNAASGNAYRVRPINALGGFVIFDLANPRPTSAPAVGGTLRVAGMNLLNFFNTFADNNSSTPGCFPSGTDADCRGANNTTEFTRQYAKTVAAILALNPDVIGVNEIENDGYGPTSAIATLVDQLNAATAPGTYAFIDVDARTGQVNAMGTDAIKVGMIYKPASVTPVGLTGALNSVAFVNGGDGAPRSRPALAQTFQHNATDGRFVAVVNHLKSKGSACDAPDAGDGQGNCNVVRVNAANALMAWLASDPTGTNEADILLIGDYNSYAMEDPITVIKNAGFTNLIEFFLGLDAYSYVFDGQWGYLDHALGSASIVSQVKGVGDYHINADEPSVLDYNTDFKTANLQNTLYAPDQFRMSDHDPVLVGLELTNAPPTANAGGPYSTNEGETVALSATGYDPDSTPVTFAWDLDNDGTFETLGQTATFNAVDGTFDYLVSVQVTDETGLATVARASVHVENVAPTVGSIAAPAAPVAVTTAFNVSASFTDPGVLDTHTASWDWGDGTTTAGVVAEANGSGSASGSHAYATPGLYTVVLTVTDKDGGAGLATFQYVVAYDPNGGFVTGGGWIDSPAGAFRPDPARTGKANFGFVAKYGKGAAVPTGQTQFQLHAANMSFSSTSYEWLVVAGARAQYKGVGTINGAGSYGFMLTVVDGQANGGSGIDKLRLKIWDGNGVIYDNQPGAADTAVPITTLGGGSIVIHGGKAGGKGVNAADVDAPATPIDEDAPANRLFLPTIIR